MNQELYAGLKSALTQAKPDLAILLPDFCLSEEQEAQTLTFMALNKTLNLSAITDPHAAIYLHLIDSWTLLPLIEREIQARREEDGQTFPADFSFLDLGTGAGFPGVPVKILRPDLNLYLVDALAKRLKFLDRALEEVTLSQPWQTVHARAEDLGRETDYRDKIDIVTARALANLPVLLEYALPLVKPGGMFIAMKAKYQEELALSGQAAAKLGAELEEIKSFSLPSSLATRSLLIYRKLKSTPAKYPRSNAQIKKAPLH